MRLKAIIPALLASFCIAGAGCAGPKDYMDPIRHPTARAKAPWKNLADYPRPTAPDTGWGMHDHTNGDWFPPDPDSFFLNLKGKYGLAWFKILALGKNKIGMVEAAHRKGVEPVVRLYRSGDIFPKFPKPEQEKEFRSEIHDYVRAGAHYFEVANEPNIGGEWSHSYSDHNMQIQDMCKNWLRVKKIVQEEGGIPIFYAMTPGSAGQWYYDCFETFKKWGKIEDAFAGAAIGIHPYPLNHPLDYPFDTKKNMPHATKEEAFNSLLKDNTCFNILMFVELLEDRYLPYQIPIIATESGVGTTEGDDRNYPSTNVQISTERNMEIFNRMNPKSSGYWGDAFFAECVWAYGGSGTFMFSGWFNSPQFNGGNHPVLAIMEKTPKFDRGVAFRK